MFSSTTLPATLQCFAENENLEFVRSLNFENIPSSKINGTEYLLIIDDSCEKICKSKTLVDIATAGKHCGLSTFLIYTPGFIKH